MKISATFGLLVALMLAFTASAADESPFFADDEPIATFALRDANGDVPKLLLFKEPDQASTAASINYWRDTVGYGNAGVVVAFRGIRFVRVEPGSDNLLVRLVGLKNEFETTTAISLRSLESGKPQTLKFGPITMGYGPVTGTTAVDMKLRYEASTRQLKITKATGYIEWQRLFCDPQSDDGSLENLTGRVAEIPAGASILKAE